MNISIKKSAGQFYTPQNIVGEMLDLCGYHGQAYCHIIDNACGNGNFLIEIVRRYCERNSDSPTLKKELETYIHAIELNANELGKAICRVDEVVRRYGIEQVSWDFICADALTVDQFDGKMDFVVGNPPYVRVHHLAERLGAVKNFHFTQSGMTDLYLVFYEIGLNMLNEKGVLSYINPRESLRNPT